MPVHEAIRRVGQWGAVVPVVLTAACSSFEPKWRQAVTAEGALPHPVAGAWEGTWKSEVTGHTGALQCVIEPPVAPSTRSTSAPTLTFTYHARWGRFFRGTFSTQQSVVPVRSGGFISEGYWDLPRWAGGRYQYRLRFSPPRRGRVESIEATYTSARDHGAFSLRRPESQQGRSRARQLTSVR